MYGKYKIQSENAKCNIRIFYSGNRAVVEGHLVSSTFQSRFGKVVRILQNNIGQLIKIINKIIKISINQYKI